VARGEVGASGALCWVRCAGPAELGRSRSAEQGEASGAGGAVRCEQWPGGAD
jgi:hypothetical protein